MDRPVLYRARFMRGLMDGIVKCRGHGMPIRRSRATRNILVRKYCSATTLSLQGAKSPRSLRYCRIYDISSAVQSPYRGSEPSITRRGQKKTLCCDGTYVHVGPEAAIDRSHCCQ